MNGFDELEPLLAALAGLQAGGRRAALVTLTRTRGPTFRRVGTRMLVFEDGHTVCELSGGCPQNDILCRARDAIASGRPERIRYDDESGLDVFMEMGCGGELDVLVEPLDGTSDLGWVEGLSACMRQRREVRLATVFAQRDEIVPVRHALWCGDELVHDGLHDPPLLQALHEQARALPVRGREVQLTTHAQHEALVERIAPPHALVVIGSSTTARALLPLAQQLGWPATLVDFDPGRLRDVPVPEGVVKRCAAPAALVESLRPDAATSVVVMTHHLHKDAEYLAALRDVPLAYVGLLGARGRVRRVTGLSGTTDLDVHAPVGLDLGAQSPAEIALSIASEILAVTRGRGGGALRERSGAGP